MIRMIEKAKRIYRATRLLARSDENLVLTSSPHNQDRYVRMLSGTCEVYPLSIAPVTIVRSDRSTLTEIVRSWAGKRSTLALDLDDVLIEPSYERSGLTQWNLDIVGQPIARDRSGGRGTRVSVLDTGIDYEHPSIRSRFSSNKGIDLSGGSDPTDRNGHGTHVAGTIAGSDVGMAPDASLYAVKVLNDFGSGTDGAILRGIDWSVEKGSDIINMSLGGPSYSRAFQLVIDAAHQRGVTIIAAAGNDGSDKPNYPAAYDNVISVGAIDKDKRRARFSNYHRSLDITAPGVAIRSLAPGGYATLSGTSMAAPHVAGACAMLKSNGIDIDAIEKTAERIGDRKEYGAGILRIDRAIDHSDTLVSRTRSLLRTIGRYI